jgi:aryl-alcohol dehydrogenase-like predicted oxidoreductase
VASALTALRPSIDHGSTQPEGTGTLITRRHSPSDHVRPAISGCVIHDRWFSSLGLGTARFCFDKDIACSEVVAEMLALGCNVIDVAGNHGGGEACAVLGRALMRAFVCGETTRDQLFVCGKAGFTEHLKSSAAAGVHGWSASGHCMRVDYLAWEFERQCRWMGLDRLDAFLLQNPEEAIGTANDAEFWGMMEAAFTTLEGFIAQGRLTFYGVSTAEAFRVSRGHPRHIDLAELRAVATSVGGVTHGFRVLEMPISINRLEAAEVAAHRITAHGCDRDLPALAWANREGMIVLASTPLSGGWQLNALAAAAEDVVGIDDPVANLLQVVRSLPGVTSALVGISTPEHTASVAALRGATLLDMTRLVC